MIFSRYWLLLIFTLPFIITGILSAITQYKIGRAPRKRLIAQLIIWILVLIGLLSAEAIYNWLFINKLTDTDSLSLFDVIQITAIVLLFYITNQMRFKLTALERRVQDLHQELSIRLSTKN